MKYCCETCGKTFVKEEEALACEKQHKVELEHKAKLKAEKNKRYAEIQSKLTEINEIIKSYNEDYHTNICIRNNSNWGSLWL
jgi:hypothetical protein